MQYLFTVLLCSSVAVAKSKEFNVVLSTNDLGGDSLSPLGAEPLVLRLDENSMSEELLAKLERSPNIVFAGLPNIPEFINSNEYNNMMKKLYGEGEEENEEEEEEEEEGKEWGKKEEEERDTEGNDRSDDSEEQNASTFDNYPDNVLSSKTHCSDCEDYEPSHENDVATQINHGWEEAIAKVTNEAETGVRPVQRRLQQQIIAIKAPVLSSAQPETPLKTLEATFEFSTKSSVSEGHISSDGRTFSRALSASVTNISATAGSFMKSVSPSEMGSILNRTSYTSNATSTLIGTFQENDSLRKNLPLTFIITVALSLLVIAVLG